jgi:Flp pilus assembly pilin Flp
MGSSSLARFCELLYRDENGQAIVEYILSLSIALMVVATIAQVLRSSLFGFWQNLSREIAAACPGCPPSQNMRLVR